ncbi:MAG: SPOR domain-containing protein [Halieaceae bacterium]
MTKDFANKSRKPAKTRKTANASPRSKTSPPSPPWIWFLAGLLCGIFLSALMWLAAQQPEVLPEDRASLDSEQQDREEAPGPRFDFYTLLPEQSVDIDIDPSTIATARTNANSDQFLLQAGSFRQAADADRRRGELLLLGLEAHVEQARGDTGIWHRVYIGPFASRSKLAKARSLTAQQGIDTLLLRRPSAKEQP